MPVEVIKKAIEVMPWAKFINAFGQTETASTIAALGPDDHLIEGTEEEREKRLKRLTSSIGRPLPDVEVKIVGDLCRYPAQKSDGKGVKEGIARTVWKLRGEV